MQYTHIDVDRPGREYLGTISVEDAHLEFVEREAECEPSARVVEKCLVHIP